MEEVKHSVDGLALERSQAAVGSVRPSMTLIIDYPRATKIPLTKKVNDDYEYITTKREIITDVTWVNVGYDDLARMHKITFNGNTRKLKETKNLKIIVEK